MPTKKEFTERYFKFWLYGSQPKTFQFRMSGVRARISSSGTSGFCLPADISYLTYRAFIIVFGICQLSKSRRYSPYIQLPPKL
jgi:hypothetical protein